VSDLPFVTCAEVEEVDVLIIGAGWAGISAARFLLEQNPQTTVAIIEAGDHIGGRSQSVSLGKNDEKVSVDLGSEWIEYTTYRGKYYYNDTDDTYYGYSADSKEERVNEIATSLGEMCPLADKLDFGPELRGEEAYKDWDQFLEGEGLLSNERKSQLLEVWTGTDGFLEYEKRTRDQMIKNSKRDKSTNAILKRYEAIHDLSDLQSEYLDMATNAEIVTEYGVDLNDLSVLESAGKTLWRQHFRWDDEESDAWSNYTYPDATNMGGNLGNLASEFAKCKFYQNVSQYVRLKSSVASVTYNKLSKKNRIYAKTKIIEHLGEKAETKIIKSKVVLSTVSLGVLKNESIRFKPTLDKAKKKTIKGMNFAVLDKWIGFWEKDTPVPWSEQINDQIWMSLIHKEAKKAYIHKEAKKAYGEFSFFFNPYPNNGNHKVLVGYVGGSGAVNMEGQSDNDINARAMASLYKMFPNVTAPDDFIVTRWEQDQNFRGAYSSPAVGRNYNEDSKDLRRRINNLFFAGEATSKGWQGSVTGAYNSGKVAAKKIRKYLEKFT